MEINQLLEIFAQAVMQNWTGCSQSFENFQLEKSRLLLIMSSQLE